MLQRAGLAMAEDPCEAALAIEFGTASLRFSYFLHQTITPEYIEVFAQGLYFAYENLTTLPAELEIIDSHCALLTLHEGRYHQVKRMFGQFQNKVIGLHRERMGPLQLDSSLAPGEYRALSAEEIALV